MKTHKEKVMEVLDELHSTINRRILGSTKVDLKKVKELAATAICSLTPAVSEEELREKAITEIVGDKLSKEDRIIPEHYVLATLEWLQSLNVQGEGKYCTCGANRGVTTVALCVKCKLIWKPVSNGPPTPEEKGGEG